MMVRSSRHVRWFRLIGIVFYRLGETQRPGKAAPTKQIQSSSAISTLRPQQVKDDEPKLIAQPSAPPPLVDIDPQHNTVDPPRLDKGKSKEENNVLTQLRTWPLDSLATLSDDLRNDFLGLDSPSDHGRDKGLPLNFSESSEPKASGPSLSKAVGQPNDGMITNRLCFFTILNRISSHSSRRRKEGKN